MQKVNRDDLGFAMKASAAFVGDTWVDVFKDPITDQGKMSKAGVQSVYFDKNEGFINTRAELLAPSQEEALNTVFLDGHIVKEVSWEDVMENVEKYKTPLTW